ncbi:MAG: HAD family phosphatase [Gemmatimonadaceae bacterium]
MSAAVTHVFFDIGGVLGSNAWDHEQRARAIAEFGLDEQDFAYRHHEIVGAFEDGRMGMYEYLEITVFDRPRPFEVQTFVDFMLAQSVPFPESIAIVRDLRARGHVRLFTLNNESTDLNVYRIARFDLRGLFDAFLSSCWLHVRKPSQVIYDTALHIVQADPARCVFIDDREQNLGPARARGMRGILYQGAEQLTRELRALGLLP